MGNSMNKPSRAPPPWRALLLSAIVAIPAQPSLVQPSHVSALPEQLDKVLLDELSTEVHASVSTLMPTEAHTSVSTLMPSARKSCNASVFDQSVWCQNWDCVAHGNTTLCQDTAALLRRCKAYKRSCSIYCMECECPEDPTLCHKHDSESATY